MKKIILIITAIAVVFLAGCSTLANSAITGQEAADTNLNEEEKDRGIKLTADGVKYLVDPAKIRGGGPPKDGIPSIDDPEFVSVEDADGWIEDDELVLGLVYDGVKRVYPLQILVWHEIVNDFINNKPVLITYCPLCGSGIAYERTIDGEAVEFGTSGKLFNSNLVMYDRKTDTYWSQIGGTAIVGELTGRELNAISIDTVTWKEWKDNNPDSEVLSKDTGFIRQYGRDPYGSYYDNEEIIFPVENFDTRSHPKAVIFGIEIDGKHKAYREADLKELDGKIEDTFNGINVLVERDSSGIVKITNKDTGEEIVKERDFWFAWAAFHPDTDIYKQGK